MPRFSISRRLHGKDDLLGLREVVTTPNKEREAQVADARGGEELTTRQRLSYIISAMQKMVIDQEKGPFRPSNSFCLNSSFPE